MSSKSKSVSKPRPRPITKPKSKPAKKKQPLTNNKLCTKGVYFDNNGTTLICKQAEKVYTDWLKCYNPSTDSSVAKPAKTQLKKSIDSILLHCGVSSMTHTIVFTSGATESNCFIIRACVKAYKKKLMEADSELLPHIVISAVEHPSIIECIKDLVESNDIEVSYVEPTIYGNILPADVEAEIKINTCLISIMHANNEIPVINNIKAIGAIAHQHNIPMHSDCVQVFGKYTININDSNIDVLSASAHKFYGPKGIGLLIISNSLIEGYQLTGEINGNQQHGLRGGTQNIAAICSMVTALKFVHTRRNAKNAHLYKLRTQLLTKLGKCCKFSDFDDFITEDPFNQQLIKVKKRDRNQDVEDNKPATGKKPIVYMPDIELVSLGPPADKKEFILPNTVLLSIVKSRGAPFCNVELKHYLDKKGFIVSVGSACATDNPNASHVLSAIGAPAVIKRGVLRISFGDMNTAAEVNAFSNVLLDGIKIQCKDIN